MITELSSSELASIDLSNLSGAQIRRLDTLGGRAATQTEREAIQAALDAEKFKGWSTETPGEMAGIQADTDADFGTSDADVIAGRKPTVFEVVIGVLIFLVRLMHGI